ncbi:hypothetical protein [Amycolatopsis sp. WGS_07]|uniref:hypothetical protein n=1 Tax=Amycolatopsis sp. WGS_07 TaxID=3076764 RepID=UPI00387319D2
MSSVSEDTSTTHLARSPGNLSLPSLNAIAHDSRYPLVHEPDGTMQCRHGPKGEVDPVKGGPGTGGQAYDRGQQPRGGSLAVTAASRNAAVFPQALAIPPPAVGATPVPVCGYVRGCPGRHDRRTQFLKAVLQLCAFDLRVDLRRVVVDHGDRRALPELASFMRAAGIRRVLVPSLAHLGDRSSVCAAPEFPSTPGELTGFVAVWTDENAALADPRHELLGDVETEYLRQRGEILAAAHRAAGDRCVHCLQLWPCTPRRTADMLHAGWQ